MEIILLFIGLAIGAVAIWFIKPQKTGISQEEVEKKFIPVQIYED